MAKKIIFKDRNQEISIDPYNRGQLAIGYIAKDMRDGTTVADCWFTPAEAFITGLSLVKASLMSKYKIPSDKTIKRKQKVSTKGAVQ